MRLADGQRKITAVVLAAGLSRRMGPTNKLLLPIRGNAMVRHVVTAALASRCTRLLVVLGHDAERVRAALSDLPVDFVLNEQFQQGIGASVRAGANAVDADSHAVIVCLGDMPLVSHSVIDRLIDAYDPTTGMLGCQAAFEGRRGNPVLWGSKCFEELRHLQGDQGARALLRRYGTLVPAVEVGAAEVLADIDTPDDYLGSSAESSG